MTQTEDQRVENLYCIKDALFCLWHLKNAVRGGIFFEYAALYMEWRMGQANCPEKFVALVFSKKSVRRGSMSSDKIRMNKLKDCY